MKMYFYFEKILGVDKLDLGVSKSSSKDIFIPLSERKYSKSFKFEIYSLVRVEFKTI